jgi:murein DD-endopeptidase MepM/ murein hydrolase activator NlpD
VGGYNEDRLIYGSSVFTSAEEPRTIHLGIDLWTVAGTPVFAPLAGVVHSFVDNASFRDYGPTIILQHTIGPIDFYTLYGHLSKGSLHGLHKGKLIAEGEKFAAIGERHENVQWPPHLHFQIITDLLGKEGDFYGVAPKSHRDYFLRICPNPNLLLRIKALD